MFHCWCKVGVRLQCLSDWLRLVCLVQRCAFQHFNTPDVNYATFLLFFFLFFFTYCLLKDLSYRKSHMAHQFSLKVLLVSKLYFLNQVRASFMLRTSLSVSLYSNVPTNMLNWLLLSLFQTDVICILLLQLYECPLAVNDDIVFIDHCTFLLLSHAWIVPSRVFACCCTDN